LLRNPSYRNHCVCVCVCVYVCGLQRMEGDVLRNTR